MNGKLCNCPLLGSIADLNGNQPRGSVGSGTDPSEPRVRSGRTCGYVRYSLRIWRVEVGPNITFRRSLRLHVFACPGNRELRYRQGIGFRPTFCWPIGR